MTHSVTRYDPFERPAPLPPVGFLSPLPGLWLFDDHTHGFTVGYYLSRLRRWDCARREATEGN
jgi:hypothetical protein